MELLPVVCLCLLTRCGITSADGNGPAVVKVEEDRDVILPCSLSSKENIGSYLFDWRKAAQKGEKKKEVFLYDAGDHYNNGYPGQSEEFKGRVFHFQEELKHGNASIIIRNTKLTDSGNYTCDFPNLGSRQTFPIELVVDCVLKDRTDENIPGTCPKPNLKILGPTKDGMLLQCEVQGAFPKPKVELKDSSGNKLPAKEPQGPDRGGLYDIILQTTVTKTDNYSCVSTQEEICHQISASTHVPVNEHQTVTKVYKGDDIILPCILGTKENIESKLFVWKKDDQKEVFYYDAGITYNNGLLGQSEEFKGRVSHFQDKLKRGDASITIENAVMTDSGNYTCDFPQLQPSQISHIELEVVKRGKPRSGVSSHSSDQTFRKVMIGVAVGVLAKCLFL